MLQEVDTVKYVSQERHGPFQHGAELLPSMRAVQWPVELWGLVRHVVPDQTEHLECEPRVLEAKTVMRSIGVSGMEVSQHCCKSAEAALAPDQRCTEQPENSSFNERFGVAPGEATICVNWHSSGEATDAQRPRVCAWVIHVPEKVAGQELHLPTM